MPVDHSHNIIEVKDISFSYGPETVLKNISLNIHQGDYIGVIGPNGAGKTTLFRIILGLLAPQTGSIKLFGTNLKDFKDWKKIGYVPQKTVNFDLNFPATVREVVAMGRYAKKNLFSRTTIEDKKAIDEALDQVEMSEYKNRLIGELSGGQAQRVFIARALVNKPEVLFLDEPTTGVDPRLQDEFYRILRYLNQALGLTLVLISHDIERVTREVMHIACVDQTLTCHLSPEEYIKESQTTNFFGEKYKIIALHHHK